MMESVSNWYEPHYFQLVKLLLLTVSLANLAASLLALVCHLLPCTSNAWLVTASLLSLSTSRCGHPTPLLLVEASLTLALLLLLLMAVLGRQAGLVGQQEVLLLGAVMLVVGLVSWQIGEHYKEERKASWHIDMTFSPSYLTLPRFTMRRNCLILKPLNTATPLTKKLRKISMSNRSSMQIKTMEMTTDHRNFQDLQTRREMLQKSNKNLFVFYLVFAMDGLQCNV